MGIKRLRIIIALVSVCVLSASLAPQTTFARPSEKNTCAHDLAHNGSCAGGGIGGYANPNCSPGRCTGCKSSCSLGGHAAGKQYNACTNRCLAQLYCSSCFAGSKGGKEYKGYGVGPR